MKKVYIAGPVSGIESFNRPAFESARDKIKAMGDEAVVPLDILPYRPELLWVDYMRADLRELLSCDEVRALPGWELSRGASIEVRLAQSLGIPVFPI